jgi:hypothetical protein
VVRRLLLNLLLRPGWLDDNNLKVFGKSLFQPEYRIINTAFEKKLPNEAIIELFNMRDDIQGEDPTKILEKVARNYQPSNDDNIINCEFFGITR